MNIELPYKFEPRPWQADVWNAVMDESFRRGVLIVPRRNGKDLLCWNLLIAKAIQRTGLYYYLGPYYTQIRQIIWEGAIKTGRRFMDFLPKEIVESKTKLDMRIHLVNGSQIKLVGSDNIDSIVGTNPIGIVYTEFSLHRPESWDYMRPVLAENDGWALFNGTPRGLNHAHQIYQLAKRTPEWLDVYLTRDDTGVPTLEAIEADRLSGMPESLIQQEYYCSWTASQENVLVPLDNLTIAVNQHLSDKDYDFAPRLMGCDVAFAAKGDKATIAERQGRLLTPVRSWQGLNNMAFAAEIAERINTWHPDAVFIDYGRGEGVIHRLEQLGFGEIVVPVHFSGKPFSELYLNKRAEIWYRMREWLIASESPCIPDDVELIEGLSAPTYFINDKGYIQLESKEHIKSRLPGIKLDKADAVALTFAEEFVEQRPRTREEQMFQLLSHRYGERAETDYDVLNFFNK